MQCLEGLTSTGFSSFFLFWWEAIFVLVTVICILEMHQLIPFSTIPNHEMRVAHDQPIQATAIQSLNSTVSEHNEKLQLCVFHCSCMPKTDTNMSISRNYNFWFSIAPVCPNWYKHAHLCGGYPSTCLAQPLRTSQH